MKLISILVFITLGLVSCSSTFGQMDDREGAILSHHLSKIQGDKK